jgi:drug/metabolite transporter (DMT)-like permease
LVLGARDQRLLGELGCGIVLAFCLGHVGYLLSRLRSLLGAGRAVRAAAAERSFMGALAYVVFSRRGEDGHLPVDPHRGPDAARPLSLPASRRVRPRWAWLIVAGLLVNIIPSTMFLRWHYLIDVVAGLVVAGVAFAVSVVVTRRELERRGDRRTMLAELQARGCGSESGSRLAPTIT